MPPASRPSPARPWKTAPYAAALAVGGALAMTVILGTVAMLSAATRGLPAAQVPLLLTESSFPWFCAAAGVFSALLAGYISSRTVGNTAANHWLAAGLLTAAGHGCVVALFGSTLAPLATAAYIGLTMPAVCLGCYFGSPAHRV